MRLKRSSSLFGFILALNACSTTQLTVESTPEGATVKLAQNSKGTRNIGVTPLTLNSGNAPELFKAPYQLIIEKAGYETQSIFVPQTTVASSGEINVALKKDANNFMDATVNAVANAQRLIFKKDYTGAEKVLSTQINLTPSIAVLHSLLGNVYYLQKKLSEALSSYQASERLESNNIEVGKMIAKLKSFRSSQEKN